MLVKEIKEKQKIRTTKIELNMFLKIRLLYLFILNIIAQREKNKKKKPHFVLWFLINFVYLYRIVN